jgi:hypothetical protein
MCEQHTVGGVTPTVVQNYRHSTWGCVTVVTSRGCLIGLCRWARLVHPFLLQDVAETVDVDGGRKVGSSTREKKGGLIAYKAGMTVM